MKGQTEIIDGREAYIRDAVAAPSVEQFKKLIDEVVQSHLGFYKSNDFMRCKATVDAAVAAFALASNASATTDAPAEASQDHSADAGKMIAPAEPPSSSAREQFVLVPLHPNREMERVMQEEEWTWAEVLAAAGTVSEADYKAALARDAGDDADALASATISLVGFCEGIFGVLVNENAARWKPVMADFRKRQDRIDAAIAASKEAS